MRAGHFYAGDVLVELIGDVPLVRLHLAITFPWRKSLFLLRALKRLGFSGGCNSTREGCALLSLSSCQSSLRKNDNRLAGRTEE
jgi:hypothetical protein